ncbi:MAG: anhydro-N-acetylmuramic acid kinase [Hyphomicrobiales bacterium]
MSKLRSSLGLMSGTSLDGIDVALIKTDGEAIVHRCPSRTYPYEAHQRAMLEEAIRLAASLTDRRARPGELAAIEWALTDWHATAVESFYEDCGLTDAEVDLIGFHGQTVLHRPEKRLTVQLGDGALLARRLGKPVVYDLRAADVAAGGEGAPLVPVYHRALAGGLAVRPVAFVNIGGIANVTWIGEDDEFLAFDTGPGNALLDDWAMMHMGTPSDKNGRLALAGRPDESALAQFLGDGFFEQKPPKSLDRNAFRAVSLAGLAPKDGAATLVEFSARSIALSRDWFPKAPAKWIICGGGRRNPAIVQALTRLLPGVVTAEDAGFDGDAMEAEGWGYLAVRCLRGLPISYPQTTRVPAPMTGGILAQNDAPSSLPGRGSRL